MTAQLEARRAARVPCGGVDTSEARGGTNLQQLAREGRVKDKEDT